MIRQNNCVFKKGELVILNQYYTHKFPKGTICKVIQGNPAHDYEGYSLLDVEIVGDGTYNAIYAHRFDHYPEKNNTTIDMNKSLRWIKELG